MFKVKSYRSFPMKLYYAHPMPFYGTKHESNEKQQILKNFPQAEIIDPGTFQSNPEKRRLGMEFCFKLISKCKILVFSKFRGKITSGVGIEINFAISKGIEVFELNVKKLKKVKKPVDYLSISETINLPGYYKNS